MWISHLFPIKNTIYYTQLPKKALHSSVFFRCLSDILKSTIRLTKIMKNIYKLLGVSTIAFLAIFGLDAGIVNAQTPVTPISITPASSVIASGGSVKLNFAFPSNTTNANLYILCSSGGTISTHTNPELCNTYVPVTSNTDWTLIFFNSGSETQGVTVVYNVLTSDGLTYSSQAVIAVQAGNVSIPTIPPIASCYTFTLNLQLGSRGDDVTALQKFLVSKGFKTDISGYFGRSTYQALKKYQTTLGIPATGFFGPLTRAAANGDCGPIVPVQPQPVACPAGYTCTPGTSPDPQPVNCPVGYTCTVVLTPVPAPCARFNVSLTIGSSGSDVSNLQTFLISKGFNIPDIASGQAAPGYFGATTKAAVMAYQASKGLPADGFVGPLTRAALNECPSVAVPSITSVAGMAAGNSEIDAGGKVGILGNYLAGNSINTTHVYIGGKQASIIQLGDSLIYATAPSDLIPGSMYDLYVSNEKGTSNSVQVKVLSTVVPPPVSNDCFISAPSVMNPSASPKLFNVDFGKWVPGSSDKTGSAIVGSTGDFWNTVAVPNCDSHNKVNLKNADGSSSQIAVEMNNLGGGWADMSGTVGINDPMLADFNYPTSNKGGNAYVTLNSVPQGAYDLYIYNKTSTSGQNGDYTVTTSSGNYGHKMMTTDIDSYKATRWQENNQFVVFRGVQVDTSGKIPILIQPSVGGFHDAQISGLQLAPAGTPAAVNYTQYQQQPDTSPVNRPPVINGVTAPVSLNVNQSGTWTVQASDPENGSLSYSVDWGDYACPGGYICATTSVLMMKSLVQTSTFTHSYASAGTYTVKFTVQDTAGQTAQTSATVQVGSSSQLPIKIDPQISSEGFNYRATVGQGFSKLFIADAVVNWSLGEKGILPPGLNLIKFGAFSGQIGGTPTKAGAYNFLVIATDVTNSSRYSTVDVTITVSDPAFKPSITVSVGNPSYVAQSDGSRIATIPFSWNSNVKITSPLAYIYDLSGKLLSSKSLSSSTAGDTSITFNSMSSDVGTGGYYKVTVCDQTSSSCGSSGYFNIPDPAPTPAPGTVNLITRIGGRTLSAAEANGCVATVVSPNGNGNTGGCTRTLVNQTSGTYQVQWNNGYPSGADTTKKPVISPLYPQSLGERPAGTNPITFFIDFQATPTSSTQSQKSSASVIDSIGGFFSRLYGFDRN